MGCFSIVGDGDFTTSTTRERLRVVRVEVASLPSTEDDDVVVGGDMKEKCVSSNSKNGISVSSKLVIEPRSELSKRNLFK